MIKPILFNTEMVQAILDGRKSCTRRLVKLPSYIKQQEDGLYTLYAEGTCYENQYLEEIINYIKPPYEPGDILYVRETWSELSSGYEYKADGENIDHLGNIIKWHPSIHMPKKAARIWLRVTDVRVERLRDITEEEAIKEGAQGIRCDHVALGEHGCTDCMNTGWIETPRDEFMQIWDGTIKKSDLDRYGWDANPWVWVIEFERCEKEGV